MAFLNVKNRASSTLAAAITSTDTSLTVATGEGAKFPASNFHITIDDEILLCTSRTGDTLTVQRAKEGTTAAAHPAGAKVELRITAQIIKEAQVVGVTKIVAASDSLDTARADYVCDGVNDNAEIQQAINEIATSGGRVVLLEGNYSIGDTITIANSNIELVGQGFNTKLKLANSVNKTVISLGATGQIKGNRIAHLAIYGNSANQTSGSSYGIYLGLDVDEAVLEHLYITDTYNELVRANSCDYLTITNSILTTPRDSSSVNGVWIELSHHLKLINNYFIHSTLNTTSRIVMITGPSYQFTIMGNFFAGLNQNVRLLKLEGRFGELTGNIFYKGSTAIEATVLWSSISGNHFRENSTNIISGSLDNSTFIGNSCWGAADYGLNLDDSEYNTISNNVFNNIGLEALILKSSNYNVVSGNVFRKNATGLGNYEIYLKNDGIDYSTDNIISNNFFEAYSSNKKAIAEQGANDNNNIIKNNYFKGFTTPLDIKGPTTEVYDNYCNVAHDERKFRTMKNTDGAAIAAGDVVIIKSVASGQEVARTTTSGDKKVFGMAAEAIANNAYGKIQILGKTTILKVNGTNAIVIGDFLSTYTEAGIAKKAVSGEMAFAIALEAYAEANSLGVIDALLITPRLI